MYVQEKLKLNKFREVSIPRPSVYLERRGNIPTVDGSYSGDEDVPLQVSKIDSFSYSEHRINEKINKEQDKSKENH